MKALVTGGRGFVGRWLVSHLERTGDDVWIGTSGLSVATGRELPIDVRNARQVSAVIEATRPDAVYHLAAIAFGPTASDAPASALETTVGGTINVLEASRRLQPPPVVFIAGSADAYGAPTLKRPIREPDPLAPVSVYGGTKAAQELVALPYGRAGLVPVVVARSFNQIGPGQRNTFFVSSMASQLAAIAAGLRAPVLEVGNLAVARDFTDVRDAVQAFRALVAGNHHGQAINVASGHAVSLTRILETLMKISGVEVKVRVDPKRVRSVEARYFAGDPGRLRRLTGWSAKTPLEQTLEDVWTDAVARLQSDAPETGARKP